ncbi:MAG: glucose/mannose-6-phosphate isomerase [Frankiaceae bacterium]|nr:glucose/mannose-6-phosphate isomerase [Frankiaceae bacterium]
MSLDVDDGKLDDVGALARADPDQMLRAVATSAAQVRSGLTAAREARLDTLTAEGRPRAVVVTGMGGSGIAGDVLAAIAAPSSPTPVFVHRGPGLPGWVGAADLVVAVSCSGSTRETLAATDEAIRRGAQLVGIAAAGSPLADRCTNARALLVPVVAQLAPRASLWALATPVLVAAARLGLLDLGPDDQALEAAARRLELIADLCRPDRESFVNPAKTLAIELAGRLPMAWGAGQTGGLAAYRFGCQMAENAKLPAVTGALPEAHHNQVVALDGALAGGSAETDLFRDRVEDDAGTSLRLRLVLLHDADGDAASAARVEVSQEVAERRGVPTSLVRSEGDGPVERLASLVAVIDYATVYAALHQSIDPTPIGPIDELKARLSRDEQRAD